MGLSVKMFLTTNCLQNYIFYTAEQWLMRIFDF